jgi:hypothetical protein
MRTKVYQLANNQFEISTPKGVYFQSYNSIIAFKPNDKRRIQLDSYYWDYSRTTGKYRNQFLNEGIAETRAKIKNKEYLLTNLNN